MKRPNPLILYLSLLVAVAQPPTATGTVYDSGSTYIGGAAAERLPFAAQTANGNSVVAFTTSSPSLPTTTRAYMVGRQGGTDGYVEVRSPAGILIAATYFGTPDDDDVRSLTIANDGGIVVAYATQNQQGATSTIVLSSPAEEYTVVLRLPATLGPPTSSLRLDSKKPIAVAACTERANGELWFVGTTEDEALSVTSSAAQGTLKGEYDCYVLGLDAGLTTLLYSSYLGTTEKDAAVAVLARTDSSMVVVWKTRSDDGPTFSVCTRLKASGEIDWTITLSGTDTVDVRCAMVLQNQDVVLGGRTTSTTLPSVSTGLHSTALGSSDGFLSVISPTGIVRVSTFIGTTGADGVTALGARSDGSVVAGIATAGSMVVSTDAWQTKNTGTDDVLVFVLNSQLSTLRFSSFAGGSGSDVAAWVSVDSSDAFTTVVWTTSADLPMPPTAPRQNPPVSELPDNAILRSKPRDMITVSPLIVNMDTVVVGASSRRTFHTQNHSSFHTVIVSQISTTNSGKQISVTPVAPWRILPLGDSVLVVTWKPTIPGMYTDTIVENVGSKRFIVVVQGIAIDSTRPPPPVKPRIVMTDVQLDSIRVGDSVRTPMLIKLLRGTMALVDSAHVMTDTLKCSITSFPQVVDNKQTYADVLIRPNVVGADSAIVQCWYADTVATAVIRWTGKDPSVITPLDMRILAPLSTSCIVDNADTIYVPIRNVGSRMTQVTVEIRDVQTDLHWIVGPIIGSTVHSIDPGATDTIAYAILASELGGHGVEVSLRSNGQTWRSAHVLRSGLPQLPPQTADVNFSRVEIGTDSTMPVVIANMSALGIRLDSVRLQAAQVALTQPFIPRWLAPGASDTVYIRFTPLDTVPIAGTLTWWSSTAVVATTRIQGSGANKPPPDTSRAILDLRADAIDSVTFNVPTTIRYVIHSVGLKALHVRNVSVAGSSVGVGLATLPPYRILAPGDSIECSIVITAPSYEAVTVRVEAQADEDSMLVVRTVPIRTKPDTNIPTAPVRVRLDASPTHMKIGERRTLTVRLDVGHAWLVARSVTAVQMRVGYRNSVIALDSSSRLDVLRGTTRTTVRKSELPADTTMLSQLEFTGCLGDLDTSDVYIDSIAFFANAILVHQLDTTLATRVLIGDAWDGGPRYVQLDTSQVAIVITPIPSALPLTVRLYHADTGGVLNVYDNTGNLTSSWTIAPTLPADIISVTINAGLSSGTYTAVFHSGTSTAVRRFVVLH